MVKMAPRSATTCRGSQYGSEPASELAAQDLEHPAGPALPADGQAPHHRAPDADGGGAERQCLHHVGTAADAAVEQQRHPAADRPGHVGQQVDRGRDTVQLPAAVVGQHDRVRPVVQGDPGVVGVQDPLRHDRQVGQGAQPVNVLPGHRGRHLDRADAGVAREAAHVLAPHPVGQVVEAVALVAVARPEHRRVDRHHQGRRPGAGRAVHQCLGDVHPRLDVQLEPDIRGRAARRLAGRRDHVLDRDGRRHAGDQDGADRGGRARSPARPRAS